MQQVAQAEAASLGDVATCARARVEVLVDPADRIADSAVAAEVTRGEAEAGVELPEALAGHHVLAGEQAGTADVLRAYGDRGKPAGLVPQPDLEIDRFVLVVLVPGQGLRTVPDAGYIHVAIGTLEPRKGLHRDVVTRVGRGMAGGECELAFFRHARRRCLQQ